LSAVGVLSYRNPARRDCARDCVGGLRRRKGGTSRQRRPGSFKKAKSESSGGWLGRALGGHHLRSDRPATKGGAPSRARASRWSDRHGVDDGPGGERALKDRCSMSRRALPRKQFILYKQLSTIWQPAQSDIYLFKDLRSAPGMQVVDVSGFECSDSSARRNLSRRQARQHAGAQNGDLLQIGRYASDTRSAKRA